MIAIIITIMVLDLKVPNDASLAGLADLSPALYLAGVAMSFIDTRIAGAIYVLVALVWFIPDRRIERGVHRS